MKLNNFYERYSGYYGVALGNEPMLLIIKHRTPKVCPFVSFLKNYHYVSKNFFQW